MFRLRKTKRTVKNLAKEILSTAKFIPRSDVEITLEDIPEELRLEQRPDIVDKIIKQEFRWSSIKGAKEYELVIKNLGSGKWKYFSNIKGTNFYIPQKLEAGKYLWKVRAGRIGYSNWSLQAEFVIDSGGNSRNIGVEFHNNILLKKKEIDQKKIYLESKPLQLAVILEGLGCNISCIYCRHKLQTKSELKFRREIIDDLAYYLPSARTVSFGGSEPMIYPEFRQICDIVESHPNVQLSVCTNGILIDEYWAKRFSKENFPKILISVDGATPETFEAMRVRGDLRKILHGIELINRNKGEKGTPQLQWNFVVSTLNFHEMVPLVEMAKEYKINIVNFKMLIVKNLELAVRQKKKDLIAERTRISALESEEECLKILDLLEQAESKAEKCGIRIIDHVRPYIYNRYPHLSKSQCTAQEPAKRAPNKTSQLNGFFCHMPFVNLSFGDGRSHFCCYAKSEFLCIPYEEECKRIDDIWNSSKYQEARRLMYEDSERARKIICKPTCPHYKTGLKSKFL